MNKYLILILSLIMFGCASTANKYAEPDGLNNQNSAKIIVYRTDVAYHSMNAEKPFFYLDNKLIGQLGTGDYVSLKVNPGEHTLSSKESIFFVAGKESGQVKGQFKQGETYYFRYSKDLANVITTGTGFFMSDSTTLQPANESRFNERK